jgi:hypothetical protein
MGYDYIEQEIVLQTNSTYGRDVPLNLSSGLFRHLEATTKPCVRMAFEGTSSSVGATPAWLERAVDVRTLGFSERDGRTIFHLKAPMLGEAAPKLFEQDSLFPGVASATDTALDVVGKIVREVRREDLASDLYDSSLLKKFSQWKSLLGGDLKAIEFVGSREDLGPAIAIDAAVAASAQRLSDQTPAPRQIRIVGKLDMVRHSTRSFELLLENGDAVRGVLVDGTPESLQRHFGEEITILGKAIYRPSGSLLRLDASEILASTEGRGAFSTVPLPFTAALRVERKLQTPRSGVSAFFGIWPGEETDDELLAALAEIRN